MLQLLTAGRSNLMSEITYNKVEVVWEDQLVNENGEGITPIVLKKEFQTLEEAKKFIDENLTDNKYTICLVV